MTLWRWLIAFLAWLSADPQAVDLEHPKAAAAVSVARASMLRDAPPPPAPGLAPMRRCRSSGRWPGRIGRDPRRRAGVQAAAGRP